MASCRKCLNGALAESEIALKVGVRDLGRKRRDYASGRSGARARPASPEPVNTGLGERAHKPVFIASGPGLRPSRNDYLALETTKFFTPVSMAAEASQAMIVNLNQYRKKRRRAEAETQAKENRVRFGRSKEERAAELRERERAKKEIENKRLD
jgi:hypothetical protein